MAGWLTRAGTALGAATLAAAVAAIPAAIRIGEAQTTDCGASGTWLPLAGVGLAPMLLVVVLFRGARVGIKAFGGPGKGSRAAGLVLWACLEASLLFVFAAMLRATTHHHALAGATFALGSVAASAMLAMAAMRVTRLVGQLPTSSRRAVLALAAAVLVMGAALLARHYGRDPSSGIGTAGASIVDLLAFFIGATFASRPEFAEHRMLALLGAPVAAALLLLGAIGSRHCPRLVDATRGQAPLYAEALAQWPLH